ncbi:hypothetical protein ES703_01627 [subsurface metagenome]
MKKGLELLHKSIELNPGFYQPRRELGLFYLRQAREQFMHGLQVLPNTHPFFEFQRKAVGWITNFLGEGSEPLTVKIKPPMPKEAEETTR